MKIANNQGVLGATIDDSIEIIGKTALYAMVGSDRDLCRLLFEKRSIFPLTSFEDRQKQ